MVDGRGEVTAILGRIASGDRGAKDQLFDRAYQELRGMAQKMMAGERLNHTLQPTALVNEAVMRLLHGDSLENGGDRSYFFGIMSRAMRRVLVDHARAAKAQRRGSGKRGISLQLDGLIASVEHSQKIDLLALDEALTQLEQLRPRQAEIIVRRFFGGFEMLEIADQLGVSPTTVQTDWRTARAWLERRLSEGQT